MPYPCHWLWEGQVAWWRAHGRGSALQKGFLEGRHLLAQRRQHTLCVSATQSLRGHGNGRVTCHPHEVSGRGASSGTCWIPLMAQLIAKDNGTSEWCPLPLPSPAMGMWPTALGQQQPPAGFAHLPCLCTSPWASRLCRCGRLQGNKGKGGAETGGHGQVAEDVRERHQIPAALPSVTCEKWCLPFFLPFHPRLVPGWAW